MAVEVISQIKQKNGLDFPIVDSNDLKGGLYSVQDQVELNNIPDARKKEGMLVYVIDGSNHWFQWLNNTWVIFQLSLTQNAGGFYTVPDISYLENPQYKKEGLVLLVESNSTLYIYNGNKWKEFGYNDSIPIYTQTTIDAKGNQLPDKYISIPEDADLHRESQNTTYHLTKNSNYVDILMSSLRALQAEVTKIQNSFKYGLYSYTGSETAMSSIISDIQNEQDEPLWAVDESNLSGIVSLNIGEDHGLQGNIDTSIVRKLKITGSTKWKNELFNSIKDNQIFIYISASNSNIKINLKQGSNIKVLDLSTIINKQYTQDIMICISRKITIENETSGSNYIYITVDNITTNANINKGYLKDNNLVNSKYELEESWDLDSIEFNDVNITKCAVYSKYQNFSNQVIPNKPNDDSYKYRVAHITIRSIDTYEHLVEIAQQLPENELIFVEKTKKLYIKNNYKLQIIGGSSNIITPEDNGMTEEQVIKKLQDMGIVTKQNGNLELSNLEDIIFINNDTGKKFKLTINAEGSLESREIINDSLEKQSKNFTFLDKDIRGFIGSLRMQQHNTNKDITQFTNVVNTGLYSDRVQIGSVYNPMPDDTLYGCTHTFIELTNSADVDIPLEGCYLHVARTGSKGIEVYHLALDGKIPAGGTYLIRGKKWGDAKDKNTFINVNSYDKEWYVDGELISFNPKDGVGIALTYGNPELKYTDYLIEDSTNYVTTLGIKKESAPYVYDKSFIDAIYYGKAYVDSSGNGYWAGKNALPAASNSISKNVFELEPAQQGYQSLNKYDSSRNRWSNVNDYQVLNLDKEFIEFPFSDAKYPIKNFTPKASYLGKNICSDKSQLNENKPNIVQVSFGKNIYTTRTFNWVSVGLFDEYVFIKQDNGWKRFESYKASNQGETSTTYPKKKVFEASIQKAIYDRFMIRFPANKTLCTSHKCIIDIVENPLTDKKTYTYVVGRSKKDGTPDLEHCSEEMTFTLYPTSYKPRVYQITDQQGFNWIEYQVWAAAAKKLNERINKDCYDNNIIPILIDTGDMTQNGTRINEWLDYYQGGYCLFNHLEQMNIVGNNDLCSTIPTDLGTGDDVGKSNSYYFHIFNCYEIDLDNLPIVNDIYVPSLYYFDSTDYRFLMVNSELTYENCRNWFKLNTSTGQTVNIYTGWSIPMSSTETQIYYTSEKFTPLYNKLFKMTDTTKKILAFCHESPFTVITNDSLVTSQQGTSRSISKNGALVGSHLNQICPQDNAKGIYWFSRLMEFRHISLVICGHKHTYTCTFQLRENYKYGNQNSKDNGPMLMTESLENDNISFIDGVKDLTKFPLSKRGSIGEGDTKSFFPYVAVPNLTGGVTYFMCQATGYKLTSNKELPSTNQKFSIVLPQTTIKDGKDSPSAQQKFPMFAIFNLDNTASTDIKLIRIKNIFADKTVFNQLVHSKNPPFFEYLQEIQESKNYGEWKTDEAVLLTV